MAQSTYVRYGQILHTHILHVHMYHILVMTAQCFGAVARQIVALYRKSRTSDVRKNGLTNIDTVEAHCYIVITSESILMSKYVAESIYQTTDCRTFRPRMPSFCMQLTVVQLPS